MILQLGTEKLMLKSIPEMSLCTSWFFFISLYSGWSNYTSWGVCSKPCGGGKEKRNRTCLAKERWMCSGSDIQKRDCNMKPCTGM